MSAFTSSTSNSLAFWSIICRPAIPILLLVVRSSCWKARRYSLIDFFSHSTQRFFPFTLQSKQISFPHLGHLACLSSKGFPHTSQYSASSFSMTIVVLLWTVEELSTLDVLILAWVVEVLLIPPVIFARAPAPIIGSLVSEGFTLFSGPSGMPVLLVGSNGTSAPQSGQKRSSAFTGWPHSGQNLSLLIIS